MFGKALVFSRNCQRLIAKIWMRGMLCICMRLSRPFASSSVVGTCAIMSCVPLCDQRPSRRQTSPITKLRLKQSGAALAYPIVRRGLLWRLFSCTCPLSLGH